MSGDDKSSNLGVTMSPMDAFKAALVKFLVSKRSTSKQRGVYGGLVEMTADEISFQAHLWVPSLAAKDVWETYKRARVIAREQITSINSRTCALEDFEMKDGALPGGDDNA